jgi:ribonuclease HI
VSVLVELHLGASVDSFGTGAWVASLTTGESHKELSGVDSLTTEDRVPLIAAIEGLRALKRRSAVEVYTPSRYLAQGAAKWLPRWKSVMAGKRADGRDRIRNYDRWADLYAVASLHDCQWHFIGQSEAVSGVVGRTAGEGSDVGYLYSGTVPAWQPSLGEYRAFNSDEMTDESICYRIEDTAEPLKPITKREARLDLIARIAKNKPLQCKPPRAAPSPSATASIHMDNKRNYK